jgi:aldose 1-epimerase
VRVVPLKFAFLTFLLAVAWLAASAAPGITKSVFGDINGKKVYQYTIVNKTGMIVKIITYGASITDIITADKNGRMGNVVFGFDSLASYTGSQNALMGAVVGRVANRIAGGAFVLDGQNYQLSANIHGGKLGFDKKVWTAVEPLSKKQQSLTLTYFSKNGEEGYPGNLKVSVSYILSDKNELLIKYSATTDKATHVNLTNHTYFNLSGGHDLTVLNTNLSIASDQFLEAGNGNMPTGKILDVSGTPLDFSKKHKIGERINDKYLPLTKANGYDLTYVLRNQTGKLKLAASAYEPVSGRLLQAYTTEPGLVFYTANHFNKNILGRGNVPAIKYGAFCLETQHYPDAPNQATFPTTRLNPGEIYHSETTFKFSAL